MTPSTREVREAAELAAEAEYARRVAEAAPPFTQEQRDRIAEVLHRRRSRTERRRAAPAA